MITTFKTCKSKCECEATCRNSARDCYKQAYSKLSGCTSKLMMAGMDIFRYAQKKEKGKCKEILNVKS